MEWTEETILRLREFWTEGHSTAEIGRRLGVSKNAVVGKAHRLELPARPSPIRRESQEAAEQRRNALRRPDGPTLPPLTSTAVAAVVMAPVPTAAPVTVRPPTAAPRPAPAPTPRMVVVAPRPYARVVTCCWPIGEPGTSSFRFCDDPSEPGKPYCGDHAKIAYVKLRDRRDDAA